MRILCLEDNALDADLLRRALDGTEGSVAIDVAGSIAEARERLAAREPYDVALLDLRLPDGDGMELLREIRAHALPVAVAILTGQGDEATAAAALRAGADDYIVKQPGYLDGLPARLQRIIERFRELAVLRARGLRVLYAETHAADIELARRHLERHAPNIQLEIVHNAAEVLARLPAAADEPCAHDVLLLDYRLPGDSALDLLKTVAHERRLDLPIVLVTGQGNEEVAAQALRLGAADYLTKHAGYLFELPATLENAHHRARLARERAALAASEARLRNLFDQAGDGIFVLAAGHEIVEANAHGLEMLGYVREDLPGLRLPDVLARPERPDLEAEVAAVLAGVPHLSEWRLRRRDGTTFVAEVSARALDARQYMAIVRDLTARRETERALHETGLRYQLAAESGKVGLWDWDMRANRVHYSREWKRQIGYAEHELGDDFEEWRSRVHPEDLERTLRAVQAFRENPSMAYEVESRFRHRDGSYRVILARASMILGEDGTPVRMMGVHLDITERVQLQAQLLHAQKMESIGLLAGGVAHDFNNLLTIIFSSSDLALASLPPEAPERRYVLETRHAAERAADLTSQLLALGRRGAHLPVVLSVNDLVSGTMKMLHRLLGERIELRFEPGRDAGCALVDPGQLEQVVINLAVNARDAMPRGGLLRLATGNARFAADELPPQAPSGPGEYVVLTVSDTGAGIAPALQERIFEPFFTTKERGRGTGLGLSTVHGIVQQGGGFIRLHSEPGRGTRFEVCLPRVAAGAASAAAAVPPPATGGNETVLVAEDDPGVRQVVTRVLESAGYVVLQAGSGDEALARMREHTGPLHLLLSDVVMPGMDARLAAERAVEERPGLRVAYLSGYPDDPVSPRASVATTVRFLQKPFRPGDLLRLVREVLDTPA